VIDRLVGGSAAFGAGLIVLMAALIVADVLGRKFLSRATLVADEYSGYMLAIIAFAGLAYTLKAGVHVRMDLLHLHLSAETRRRLSIALYALGIVYGVVLTWQLADLAFSSYATQAISSTPARTPMALPQAFLPAGAAILVLQMGLEASLLIGNTVRAEGDARTDGQAYELDREA
jgi:TRAP-type C4-dicarboxylate transport system permease small subunit